MTDKPITITCRNGRHAIPAHWVGQHLAVHRPVICDGDGVAVNDAHGQWVITHIPTGLSAWPTFHAAGIRVGKLAKLWDATFGELTGPPARRWRWAQTWAADARRVEEGLQPEGPILPDNPTARDVAAAITGIPSIPASDAAEPLPQSEIPATVRGTMGEQHGRPWPMVKWHGRSWFVPTMGQLEGWIVGDETCSKPNGADCDPDDRDSWLSILGLI